MTRDLKLGLLVAAAVALTGCQRVPGCLDYRVVQKTDNTFVVQYRALWWWRDSAFGEDYEDQAKAIAKKYSCATAPVPPTIKRIVYP